MTSGEADLPEGWAFVRLGAIADVQLGKMLDREKRIRGTKLTYLRNANVRWSSFDLSSLLEMPFEDDELDRYSVRDGDLMVCEGGEPGRAAVWRGGQTAIKYQKALLRVRPSAGISPDWLLYSLRHDALAGNLEQHFTGSTIKHFPRQAVLNYDVALPPLPEQKRIVARTKELLARVNAARERLARVPAILKRFRQAVLAAACEGRLTEDWRERLGKAESSATRVQALKNEHTRYGARRGNASPPTEEAHDLDATDFPSTWTLTELEILCEPGRPITYGILKPGPHVPGGVPYVRVADYPRDRILDPAGIRRTSSKIAADYQRATLRGGDLLLAIRGTYGRVCRVPALLSGGNITQDTARLSIHPSVNADYVAWCLRSPGAQDRMKRAAKGVAVRGINIGDVRALQVPLPPVDEQTEIVRRVEALLTLADAIEKRIAAATARAGKLAQAILANAFRGELVPTEADLARQEGRHYESAAALLERISRARAIADEKPASRTGGAGPAGARRLA